MKFHLYRDRKKEWRWRLRARNGRIVAVSGEGYQRRRSALDAILRLPDAGSMPPIVDDTKGVKR